MAEGKESRKDQPRRTDENFIKTVQKRILHIVYIGRDNLGNQL